MLHIALLAPMLTGDDYNTQAVGAIGSLLGAMFILIQPLLSTIGLIVILVFLARRLFARRH